MIPVDASVTNKFVDEQWLSAIASVLDTIAVMQTNMGTFYTVPYSFQRNTPQASDTLGLSGRGPCAKVTGLSRSLFRPSDDAVVLVRM